MRSILHVNWTNSAIIKIEARIQEGLAVKMISQFISNWAKYTGAALGISTVIGSVISFVVKWPVLQGIYVMCFVFSIFAMLYASVMFVGTPQMRYDYLVRGRMLRKHGRGHEVEAMEDKGFLPGVIALTLMIIGFALEASMH